MIGAGVPPIGIPTYEPVDGTSVTSAILLVVFLVVVFALRTVSYLLARRRAITDRTASPAEDVEPRPVEESLTR